MPSCFGNLIYRITAAVAAIVLVGFSNVNADVIDLRGGGRISGDVDQDDTTRDQVSLRTSNGIKLTIRRTEVAALRRQKASEVEYGRRAPQVADTVAEQWRFAEWCRENRLTAQRRVHLRRIVELDPDHAKAWHGLGYSFVQGQWRRPKDWQEEEGYVRYEGRWRTPQEISLIKARNRRESAERTWIGNIKRLRVTLASPRALEARRQILAIRDANAVRALRENLAKEQVRGVKMLYIGALGAIADDSAYTALIEASLNDGDSEVFHACLDQLVDGKPHFAVEAYVKGLKDANNVRVNRSGYALSQLGDAQAIGPLIDALITSHKLVRPGRSADAMSTTFSSPGNQAARDISPGGGTSFSAGSSAKVASARVQNQSVLAALVRLSGGASFGFNQTAWSNWYAANRSRISDYQSRRSQ